MRRVAKHSETDTVDTCVLGCDHKRIIVVPYDPKNLLGLLMEHSEEAIPTMFQCQDCQRIYEFSVNSALYEEGLVTSVVLKCITPSGRHSRYDDLYSVQLVEPDDKFPDGLLPSFNVKSDIKIVDFLSGDYLKG